MKKISHYLTAMLLVILLVPAQSFATSIVSESTIPVSSTSKAARTEALLSRLNEIKDMDKSKLSAAERKELRKEVRAIKDSVKTNGGVYISVGAIIIILLILILVL